MEVPAGATVAATWAATERALHQPWRPAPGGVSNAIPRFRWTRGLAIKIAYGLGSCEGITEGEG